MKKRSFVKGILAAALALFMLVGVAAQGSVTVEATETEESDETEKQFDKKATPVDDNGETEVTLTVNGSGTVENVAVIFVLDYSTSVNVRNAAAEFLHELASKENTNIKAAVVNYSSVAVSSEWKDITSDSSIEELEEFLKSNTSSGTNYHAGLLAAEKLLDEIDTNIYTTYLITISDGITYLWTDDDSESDTYGSTMSVWIEGEAGDNQIAKWNSNDAWKMRYGYGSSLTQERLNLLTSGAIASTEAYANTMNIAYVWKSEEEIGDNFIPIDEYDSYLIGSEVAIYKTASVYNELTSKVNHTYAFKMDEGNWSLYPYGEQLMDYLIGVSDNDEETGEEISDTTAEAVFSSIEGKILNEINYAVVNDVIGDEFDLILDSFELTIDDAEPIKGVVNGNTVNFGDADEDGNYSYSVVYNPDGEFFVWNINVPVEYDSVLQLSYKLKVSNTEPGVYIDSPTNESADITPNGGDETEEFPPPEVSYVNIAVTKTWVDGNNESGTRPESITLYLYKNGSTEPYKTAVVTDDNDGGNVWTYTFVGLPYSEGDTYTVEEKSVDGYTCSTVTTVDDSTDMAVEYYFSNSVTGNVQIAISKVWDDSNDQDGIRPSSITGYLTIDSAPYVQFGFELNEDNDWSTTITTMKYDGNGYELNYDGVFEVPIDGYTATVTGSLEEGFVITNTHTPEDTTTTETTDTTDTTDTTEDATEDTVEETAVESTSDPVATTSADTGDNSNLELFVGLIAVCVVAMVALVTVETRKRRR